MKKIVPALFICLSMTLPALSFAGYVFEKEMDAGSQKMTMVYSIEGSNKRIDIVQNGITVTSMISTPERHNPLMLMHAQKGYMEQKPLSENERAKMEEARAQSMMKGMEGMSKEQRDAMQKMMKSNREKMEKGVKDSPVHNPKDFTVKTTGEKKAIGSYKATLVQVYYKGKHFQDQWVTKDIPAKAISAMDEFINDKKLNPSNSEKAFKEIKAKVDSYGYPVLTISKINDETRSIYGDSFSSPAGMPSEIRVEMKKIEDKNLSKTSFEIPKGYKEMKVSM